MNSVLIVDLGLVWGGQEVYSAGLAEALAAAGRRVSMLSGHTRHARPGVEYIPCDFSYAQFPATRRRVLDSVSHRAEEDRLLLGYRTARSGMTLGCGVQHRLETACRCEMCRSAESGGSSRAGATGR